MTTTVDETPRLIRVGACVNGHPIRSTDDLVQRTRATRKGVPYVDHSCRQCNRDSVRRFHARTRRGTPPPDEIAIERATWGGETLGSLTKAEASIVVATLTRRGYTAQQIAERLHTTQRTVTRYRVRNKQQT